MHGTVARHAAARALTRLSVAPLDPRAVYGALRRSLRPSTAPRLPSVVASGSALPGTPASSPASRAPGPPGSPGRSSPGGSIQDASVPRERYLLRAPGQVVAVRCGRHGEGRPHQPGDGSDDRAASAARRAVDTMFESVATALARGERVVLRRFGVFHAAPRQDGRGPESSDRRAGRYSSRTGVRFRPATDLRNSPGSG